MQVNRAATMELEWVPANATLDEVARKMRSADVGLLLIADKGNLLGVITDRDIVTRAVAVHRPVDKLCARDIMSEPVVCIDGQADLADAGNLMAEKKVRRLVVTNGQQVPVGVLSIDDLVFSTHGTSAAARVLEDIAHGPQAQFRTA